MGHLHGTREILLPTLLMPAASLWARFQRLRHVGSVGSFATPWLIVAGYLVAPALYNNARSVLEGAMGSEWQAPFPELAGKMVLAMQLEKAIVICNRLGVHIGSESPRSELRKRVSEIVSAIAAKYSPLYLMRQQHDRAELVKFLCACADCNCSVLVSTKNEQLLAWATSVLQTVRVILNVPVRQGSVHCYNVNSELACP